MNLPALLFIAGVPASGKSYFGRWLEAEHGYVHIDAEVGGELERLGLRPAWDDATATQDCTRFAAVLRSRGRPAIFNWGFPLGCIHIAAALQRAGFAAWWFNASPAAARAAYTRLGRSAHDFDAQLLAIQSATAHINKLFGHQRITVLNSAGVRLKPATIFARICRAV